MATDSLALDELIGIGQLMLRWPLDSFRKIAFMAYTKVDIGTSQYHPYYRPRLTPYLAESIMIYKTDINDTDTFFMGLREIEYGDWEDSSHFEKIFPHIFCKLSEINKIENENISYKYLPDIRHKYSLERCTPINIGKVAPLIVNYINNFNKISDHISRTHNYPDMPPDEKYMKDYSFSLGSIANGDEIFMPDKAMEYNIDSIMPTPPDNWCGLNFQDDITDDILEILKFFCMNWARKGQTNPKILAKYLHSTFSKLALTDIGRLLPAEYFPVKNFANSKKINYSKAMYENLDIDAKDPKHRVRGKRLLE